MFYTKASFKIVELKKAQLKKLQAHLTLTIREAYLKQLGHRLLAEHVLEELDEALLEVELVHLGVGGEVPVAQQRVQVIRWSLGESASSRLYSSY